MIMLKIDLSSKDLKLTDAIVAGVEKKIGVLDKYLKSATTPTEVRVEVFKSSNHHKKGEIFEVVANLKLGGSLLRVETSGVELYEAIDRAKDELKREITKRNGEKIDVRRSSSRAAKEKGTETELV
jgi:ribosomal subunit interface protein